MNSSYGSQFEPNDSLQSRLRSEALSERPAFSPGLEQRILERVHRERSARDESHRPTWRTYWPAAAAVILVSGFTAYWTLRSHKRSSASPSIQITRLSPPPAEPRQAPPAAGVNIGGTLRVGDMLSARLWPPEIRITVPRVQIFPGDEAGAVEAGRSSSLRDPPEQVLATLQRPTSRAQEAIAEVIPAPVADLAALLAAGRRSFR